jgi:fibrillarin-like pre-rRNA processing protein
MCNNKGKYSPFDDCTMSAERVLKMDDRIYTLDAEGGRPVYGEKIIEVHERKYREWIPWRSKLGALLRKRDYTLEDADILYLGAAQGTTVSHLSDILERGRIFAVEFSPVAFRKLAGLSRRRNNIIPILGDAFYPEKYRMMVPSVDLLYQDVSQKEQVEMFNRNADIFLGKEGRGLLMLKSRSVDVTARPEDVYDKAVSDLRKAGFEKTLIQDLSPFQKDHAAIGIRPIL